MDALNPATAAQDALQAFLHLQPEDVRSELTIATPETVGQSYFLRIDKNVPEKYIPNMPKSAMKSENMSVPRVTVAPTLIGCFVGYFRAEHDLVYSGYADEQKKEQFKGGYYISRLPFQYALKPSDQLVGDQARSNEHWLVTYDESTVEFTPEVIGKFFLSQVAYLNTGGATMPVIKATGFLEVSVDDFELNEHTKLKAGYYRFDLLWRSLHARTVEDESAVRNVTPISQEDYLKQKHISADMLQFQAPKFFGWK